MENKQFSVTLTRLENYLFQVDFGAFGNILTDEPEPLGSGEGPGPAAMLAASVANCLSASLLFALLKHKEDPGELSATVTGTIARVERFQRITEFNVHIQLGVPQTELEHLPSALRVFENFCTVTQSVRHGIPVSVQVSDSLGTTLHVGHAETE
jgi:uncharacterized OsmC-like protein